MLTKAPMILVVEDDEVIQALVEHALTEGGFDTETARAGEEAVTLLKGRFVYRAVVVDINLVGRRNGWEVARAAREIDPQFPVVYMSGVTADQWTIHGVPESMMLPSPFAPAQLIT